MLQWRLVDLYQSDSFCPRLQRESYGIEIMTNSHEGKLATDGSPDHDQGIILVQTRSRKPLADCDTAATFSRSWDGG